MSAAMPGDVFGPNYRIQRELGSGGMATVYLADDAKHGRQVALKVLHPEFAASLGPTRFRREITLAARLQHPHIVSVYDSGETATGLLWFTMPYVVGESLRDRLSRDGQLSLEDTVRITTEIADALQCAHDHGVLHRDVKPENILLSGGHALLADFGIARTLAGDDALSSATPAATLTQSGFAVGTPTYMSPEQASGEHAIDARSDQYGLGVVAYEMLAGERPFTAPDAAGGDREDVGESAAVDSGRAPRRPGRRRCGPPQRSRDCASLPLPDGHGIRGRAERGTANRNRRSPRAANAMAGRNRRVRSRGRRRTRGCHVPARGALERARDVGRVAVPDGRRHHQCLDHRRHHGRGPWKARRALSCPRDRERELESVPRHAEVPAGDRPGTGRAVPVDRTDSVGRRIGSEPRDPCGTGAGPGRGRPDSGDAVVAAHRGRRVGSLQGAE